MDNQVEFKFNQRKSARRKTTVHDSLQLNFKKKKIESPSSSQEETKTTIEPHHTHIVDTLNNTTTSTSTTTITTSHIDNIHKSEQLDSNVSTTHTNANANNNDESEDNTIDNTIAIDNNNNKNNNENNNNNASSSSSSKEKRKLTLMGKKERIGVLQKIIDTEVDNLEKSNPAELISHLKEFTSLFVAQLTNPPPTILECNNLNIDLELREKKLIQTVEAWEKEERLWNQIESTLHTTQTPTTSTQHTPITHSLPPLPSPFLDPRELINETAIKLDKLPLAITQIQQQSKRITSYLNHTTTQLHQTSNSKSQDPKDLIQRFIDTTPMSPPHTND